LQSPFFERYSTLFEFARIVAISLAAVGAFAMSFGAQFQNDAVGSAQKSARSKASIRSVLNLKQLVGVMRRPRWLAGTSLLGLATVLQLAALSLAPLIVVQPVGVIALVVTSFLNARLTKTRLNRATLLAISLCTVGIAGFVVAASLAATQPKIDDNKLRSVLTVLVSILIVFGVAFLRFGKRLSALAYIVGTGVLYGFVATLAKVVIARIEQAEFEWLTIFCALALIVAMALGGWFVQNAYSSGPPDLVIAGLTVIDPLVAVVVGVVILGEMDGVSVLIALPFIVCAALAVTGVLLLAQVHPEMKLAKNLRARITRRRLL
jgi:drug/metabolite transporter (DMT)-like permease